MKDPRTVLDAVRSRIPPDAKLLIAYFDTTGGPVHLAQANMTQADIIGVANGLAANAVTEKMIVAKR